MYGFTFNGKHNFTDFGLILESKSILPPEKTKVLETVPYMNNVYDFSTVGSMGDDVYGERTIHIKLSLISVVKTKEDMQTLYQDVCAWLMDTGGKVPLVFDDIPNFYFNAECRSVSSFDETWYWGFLEFDFYCDAFKYSNSFMGDDIWDTFNFITDYTQYTNQFTISGSTTIAMYNNGRMITPVINADSPMTVTFNNITYSLVVGDNTPWGMKLQNGENDLTFNGNGTAKIIFRWEAL